MRQQQYARHNHCHHNCHHHWPHHWHHHWPHHYYCHIILCSDIIIIFILYVTNDCIGTTTIIMTKVKFFKKNIESIFHLEPTPHQPSSSHQRWENPLECDCHKIWAGLNWLSDAMTFVRQNILNIFTTGYGSVRGGKISPSIRTTATEVDLREMSEEKSFEIFVQKLCLTGVWFLNKDTNM